MGASRESLQGNDGGFALTVSEEKAAEWSLEDARKALSEKEFEAEELGRLEALLGRLLKAVSRDRSGVFGETVSLRKQIRVAENSE